MVLFGMISEKWTCLYSDPRVQWTHAKQFGWVVAEPYKIHYIWVWTTLSSMHIKMTMFYYVSNFSLWVEKICDIEITSRMYDFEEFIQNFDSVIVIFWNFTEICLISHIR